MATNEEGAKNSRQLKGLKWKTQKALDGEGKDPLVGFDEDGNRIVNLGKDASIFSEGEDGSTAEVKGGQFVVTDTSGNETVLSGGSEVVANPTEEATEALTKIGIEGVNYNVQADKAASLSSSGDRGSVTIEDGVITASSTVTTSSTPYTFLEASGPYSSVQFSGNTSYAAFSGNTSYVAFSGDYSHADFSGHGSHASFSGNTSYVAFSGSNSYAAFSDKYSHASFSGNTSYVAFSGSNSYAAFSGNESQVRLLDLDQIAIGSFSGTTFTPKAVGPATPTDAGTYTLQCVVNEDGAVAFNWISAS